jgi:hypothetical protein
MPAGMLTLRKTGMCDAGKVRQGSIWGRRLLNSRATSSYQLLRSISLDGHGDMEHMGVISFVCGACVLVSPLSSAELSEALC